MIIRKYIRWFWLASEGGRFSIVIQGLLGILQVGVSLSLVYVCKGLIDMVTGECPPYIYEYSALMVLAIISQIAISAIQSWLLYGSEINLRNRLRDQLFERLLNDSYENRPVRHTGDILNRLEEDVRTISSLLTSVIPSILSTGVQCVAAFIFLCYLNYHIAWLVVFIMPVCLLLSKVFMKKVKKLTLDIRETDSEVQTYLQESLQHLVLLQTLEQEKNTGHRLHLLHKMLYQGVMRLTRFSIFSRTMISGAFALGYAVAFLYGVHGILLGYVSFGMMTAFIQLVNQMQRPMVQFSHQIPAIVRASASMDRLIELMGEKQIRASESQLLSGSVGVRFENVTFSYTSDAQPVLSEFNYDFIPGSKIAIVGETGIGKSTLIKLIMALNHPQKGEIYLYNQNQTLPASIDTRCNIVYVPQGNSLLNGTIRENLLLANPNASDDALRYVLQMAEAQFVFDFPKGWDTSCAELGKGLSEGQAQRIAIARALLRKGNVLLLDEISSSLDESTESRLMQNLIAHYADRTIIFITHRSRLTEFADKTLNLK